MKTPEKPNEPALVRCEICLKEIPASEARVSEAQDYVANFCGLKCYEKWIEKARKSGQSNSEP